MSKIKLTNQQILDSFIPLNEIVQKDFPIRLSFIFSKNSECLSPLLKIINKKKDDLLLKYGEIRKDENGKDVLSNGKQFYIVTDFESYNGELKELVEIENEVDIDLISKIDFIAQCEAESIKIKPSILINLSWIFKD